MGRLRVVPEEVTKEMFDAGYAAAAFPRDAEICAAMFRAMLSATPPLDAEMQEAIKLAEQVMERSRVAKSNSSREPLPTSYWLARALLRSYGRLT